MLSVALSGTSAAQDDSDSESRDQEARSLFQAGTTAFEAARYSDALDYYQRAYEVSGRAALLYNIGVSADRLRRDRQALEAFEAFLGQVPEHPRRHEVEVRVVSIRESLAASENAASSAGGDPDVSAETTVVQSELAPEAETGGLSTGALVGAIALGAVGLAGVVTAVVGMAAGGCVEEDATGTCIQERTTNWGPVAAFGGLGILAIAGAVVLLVVGSSNDGDEDARVRFEGNGVRWQF